MTVHTPDEKTLEDGGLFSDAQETGSNNLVKDLGFPNFDVF